MPGSLGYLKHAGCHLSRTLCEIGRPKEDSPALTVTVQTYSEGYRSSVQLGYMEAGAVYWDHMVIPVHTRDGVIGVMESSQLLPKGEASLCLLRRLRLYSCAMAGDGDPI
eukprot:jgi/Tetstr1/421735/TSEL_001194.t1